MQIILFAILAIFSADGVSAGSGERSLPMVGADLATGRMVLNLPAQSAAVRVQCGWYTLESAIPAHFVITGYDFDRSTGVASRRGYIPEPPEREATYSKLKLYAALSAVGLWDDFEAWLKTQTVDGLNAWTAFSLAQDLSSDDERFTQFAAAAAEALGVDAATVKAILEASEL